MFSRTTIARIVPSSVTLLLFFLALLLPWAGWIGPIRPSPDRVVVFVNDEEIRDIEESVRVKKGETVKVSVQVYYQNQGEPIDSGEFSYQWCFTPPFNNNLHCEDNNFKGETNFDYKPTTSAEQKLTIIIHHDILKTAMVTVLFKPE